VVHERRACGFKVEADDGCGLLDEVSAVRGGEDGRSEDDALEWTKADAIYKADEVKVAERLGLRLVDCLSEPVCEERITRDALGFVDEEAEGEESRGVPGGGVDGEHTRLGGGDEPAQKV
jgi:hypothetical protein